MLTIACIVLIVFCGYLFLVKCLASLTCFGALFVLPGAEKVAAVVGLVWNVFWAAVWVTAINFLFHVA
ncbi:hypothetical protein [Pseudomonas phage LY218]|uniref:Uncharacterized protein n=3 Tax=Litunavirus Ab09 TaxID=1920765 RepID=A0A0A7NPB4_9CAUD|nr:hypothetical protein FG40_gp07 [Pseudomonas phage vB_PaeP_C2-10_Ab09]YP_009148188.1 hypothetical protein ACQ21_gp08 [Pseudomonas phage Pa2]YP_010659128.1 hypothetical protein PP758_gp66 [Pseudomonas phage PAP02]AIZ94941.1 hypothetical protein [Pseudomonas phage phi176]QHZ59530.1 hypothetical protein [Pseudomonas phage LY218]WJZ48938.1 hypothetical protein [Pseudomonas phage PA15]AIZ94850.1 hypothetical protein [Pseudomonas phage Pa2]QKE55137.1 hypothetical protein PAP02_066 [Pseudomonas p